MTSRIMQPPSPNRWICRRVLSPAAPLFHEVGLLLSEDPTTAKARKINLYHATLAGIATGHHAHAKLTSYVKLPGASLAPILESLVSAELVERIDDPIRINRPTYHPADSLVRFHYAIIRRHQSHLGRHDADARLLWRQMIPTFGSQVVGPAFEATAGYWTTHVADHETIGGAPEHVGPTVVRHPDGSEAPLDVVVAAGTSEDASQRRVLAPGEAKAGERIALSHLRRLEAARATLGRRAAGAKLLLFGATFASALSKTTAGRSDVELIDLDRLYAGS